MKIDISKQTAASEKDCREHKNKLARLLEDTVKFLKKPTYCHVTLFKNHEDSRDLLNYIRISLRRKGVEVGWVNCFKNDHFSGEHQQIMIHWDDSIEKPTFHILKETLEHMVSTKLMRAYCINPMWDGYTKPILEKDLQEIWYHHGYLFKGRFGKRSVSFRSICNKGDT